MIENMPECEHTRPLTNPVTLTVSSLPRCIFCERDELRERVRALEGVELRDEDLQYVVGCAAAHPDQRGGQHVARSCSAVAVTHVPSGVTVTAREHRSQYKNKAAALRMLRAALATSTKEQS